VNLPQPLKAHVQRLSGLSLDEVKVHYNSPEPARLQALAYAQSPHVHVGPGQEMHLPHEAWHIVQQMQGRVAPTIGVEGVSINEDLALEREADDVCDHLGRHDPALEAKAEPMRQPGRPAARPRPISPARAPIQRQVRILRATSPT
jgi:hypothetical protein